ncbi:DUF983 domain-containing protein [Flexibacterium corallicola]|uniref:DUF983 domain-containing protein n=1 Tax=Flexibacterium corallicola TaxID=3037259 RepID=UPI00286EE8EF|nr:DUF983 domain-containing protein [Pseudovibrio sp. M1P-2-3]
MSSTSDRMTPPAREISPAMIRGGLCKCPACGSGKMFKGYLTVSPECSKCGEELFHHRADDAPPYFTIFIVGHIVVGMALSVEMSWFPPIWLHMALWIPLTIIMALALLRPIKGAMVGLQWALRMYGFDASFNEEDEYVSGSSAHYQ